VAEITVERKPRSPLPVIVGLLLLAVVGYLAWRYVAGNDGAGADAPVMVDSAAR